MGLTNACAGIPIKWSSTGFSAPVATNTTSIPAEVTHYASLISDLTIKCKSSCKRIFSDDVRGLAAALVAARR